MEIDITRDCRSPSSACCRPIVTSVVVTPMLKKWIKSEAHQRASGTSTCDYAGGRRPGGGDHLQRRRVNGKPRKFARAKDYIEKQCAAHGIKIDADTVQVAIENAWKSLGLDQAAPSRQNSQ